MKKILAIICLAVAIIFSVDNNNTTQANVAVGFNLFFDALSPYGNWVSVPRYGNVWYPTAVGPHWRPYTDGRWVWSDYGWTWASYEPWGWAPYHYGRWVFLDYYGWVWIPGTFWAPAWVTWYNSPGYIGWAPLAPDNDFFLQIGIGFNSYNYYVPPSHCVFVPSHKFLHHHVHSIVVPQSHNVKIFKEATHINNIKIVNNKVINHGPDVGFVERIARTKVHKVNLIEKNIDTRRVIKSHDNVNKLDGRNYYIFRPDTVRKDKESALPNGESIKSTQQIEKTDDSVLSQENLKSLTNRKQTKIKNGYIRHTERNRNKNKLRFSNSNLMENNHKFQNKNNLENSLYHDDQINSDNKKRNSLKNTFKTQNENPEEKKPYYSNEKKENNWLNRFLDQNNAEKSQHKGYPINSNKRVISFQKQNTNQFQNIDRQLNKRYRDQKNTGRKFPKESSRSKHNELD